MASVQVTTTVAQVRIGLSREEALALLTYFGGLDQGGAPAPIREIIRKFRAAVQEEVFITEVP